MRWSRVAAIVLIVLFLTPAFVLAGAAKKTMTLW